MDWTQIKTNWPQVKGKFHSKWGKLTDDDLKTINGKKDELVGTLQKRYSLDKPRAEREAEDFVKTLH